MQIQDLLHEMDPRALLAKRPVMNYASRLNWAIWAFTIASAVFLALRVYCKFTRARTLWWDDHFLIGSWVSNAAATGSLHPRVALDHADPDCCYTPARRSYRVCNAHRSHQVRTRTAL
jgi:hypothetical protein